MKIKTFLTISVAFLLVTKASGQSFTSEELSELNTAVAISSAYTSMKKYTCALHALENLSAKLQQKIARQKPDLLSRVFAEIYRLNGDTVVSENFCIQWLRDHHVDQIQNMRSKKDPFYFVYRKNSELLDSLWMAYSTNIPLQDRIRSLKDELKLIDEGVDQTMHMDPFSSPEEKYQDSVMKMMKRMGSAQAKRLVKLMVADSTCELQANDWNKSWVHLSKYDTTTFKAMVKYNNRCLAPLNSMMPMITENRLISLYDLHTLLEINFESLYSEALDFAAIDRERKKVGLPSLLFKIVINKKPIPPYYDMDYAKYFNCTDN